MVKEKHKEYYDIKKDRSGSIAQNRFTYQKYWTIIKIYKLFETQNDFLVFLDSESDLDIYFEEKYHFFQIKTSEKKQYSVKKIISEDKTGKSILGTLSKVENRLVNIGTLNIVSNQDFFDKTSSDKKYESICFKDLKEEKIKLILEYIKNKHSFTPLLTKYYYIKSNLPINETHKFAIGETVSFLENIFKNKSTRSTIFLEGMDMLCQEKLNYEYDINDETLHKKTISQKDISQILKDYNLTEENADFERYLINQIEKEDVYLSLKLNQGLIEINKLKLFESNIFNEILLEIKNLILNNSELENYNNSMIIKNLYSEKFLSQHEYSENIKKCLIFITILKIKKGII